MLSISFGNRICIKENSAVNRLTSGHIVIYSVPLERKVKLWSRIQPAPNLINRNQLASSKPLRNQNCLSYFFACL